MRLLSPCLLFCLEESHKPLEIGVLSESLGSFWSVTFEPFQVVIANPSSHPELKVHQPLGKRGRVSVDWNNFSSIPGTLIKQMCSPSLLQLSALRKVSVALCL